MSAQPGPMPTASSVFINCPFDTEYKALRDAIILSVVACSFEPRTAIDTHNVSTPRMDRIADAMQECSYSIHDLTRCNGSGDWNIARYNMPLELGMAISMQHDWLVLVPAAHPYAAFVSDLAGYDLIPHDSTPPGVIRAVMAWLSTRHDNYTMRPPFVIDAFARFQEGVAKVELEWDAPLAVPVQEAAVQALSEG